MEKVLKNKLGKGSTVCEKITNLLSLKICDPACGSGAFLIAATNFLARELAILETNQIAPSDEELRTARRKVLQNCIYGVDLNPMAVELVKVSLWIDSAEMYRRLNFLDHHIKVGDSLIGSTKQLVINGIPLSAFKAFDDDDKALVNYYKKANTKEHRSLKSGQIGISNFISVFSKSYQQMTILSEDNASDVKQKRIE